MLKDVASGYLEKASKVPLESAPLLPGDRCTVLPKAGVFGQCFAGSAGISQAVTSFACSWCGLLGLSGEKLRTEKGLYRYTGCPTAAVKERRAAAGRRGKGSGPCSGLRSGLRASLRGARPPPAAPRGWEAPPRPDLPAPRRLPPPAGGPALRRRRVPARHFLSEAGGGRIACAAPPRRKRSRRRRRRAVAVPAPPALPAASRRGSAPRRPRRRSSRERALGARPPAGQCEAAPAA